MQIKEALSAHLDPVLSADAEASKAFEEFLKNIPVRVLQCEVDPTVAGKRGVVQGEKVYKFGAIPEKTLVFFEFFENRNQGEPSMGLYVDKAKSLLTVKGWRIDKRYFLCFKAMNGKVEKVSKLED